MDASAKPRTSLMMVADAISLLIDSSGSDDGKKIARTVLYFVVKRKLEQQLQGSVVVVLLELEANKGHAISP